MKHLRRLVTLLTEEMDRRARAHGWMPELGTIQRDGSLRLDSGLVVHYYFVADHLLTDPTYLSETENDGEHSHSDPQGGTISGGAHVHKVKTPRALQPLRVGDRVLVLPLYDRNQFVVVARLKVVVT